MAGWTRLGRAAGTLLLLQTICSIAHGQSATKNKAAAEALFQEGKTLFGQAQYEQACSKFAASQELDAGFGTLMNLGECYEQRGMTASAWATFTEAAGLARASGQTERETNARARARMLESKLSRLVVSANARAMEIEGLEVRLNGTALPRAVWGSLVPVDPGTQRVEVRAPGYRPWSSELVVPQGAGEARLEVPELEREPEPPATAPPIPVAPPSARSTGARDWATPTTADEGSGQRTTGYVLLGVGAGGLVLGSIFGLQAFAKNGDSDALCPTENRCLQPGLDLREEARDAAMLSTIAFVAGGALTASGVALILTAPKQVEQGPTAGRLRLTSQFSPSILAVTMEGNW